MFNILRLICIGIIVGMANVVPGVSGGTLAVVFNIYDQFVNAITFNLKKIWANRRFVFPLLGGMALGVLIFSKIITFLYTNYPFQTNCFFTGLILGSIPLLFSLMIYGGIKKGEEKPQLKAGRIIGIIVCFIAGLIILLTFNYLENVINKDQMINKILPEINLRLELRLFFAGFVGAVAMIVPGISGSLLMLMMGVYTTVITAIPALFSVDTFFHAFFLLIPNGVGVLLGLLCGAKLISFLLKKLPHQTYAVIFGLICGSVIAVFPGFSGFKTVAGALSSAVCISLGIALAFFSSKIAPEKKD
ncbi:MAG: DUF368 domain-containing protein [Treponema sp.]|nr:DUF368 domain-containing protein [Treponema sp.]